MIRIVNIVPAALSGETQQDSEPNLAVNPERPTDIVATAFTPAMGGDFAPVYLSQNGGATWELRNIVPGNGPNGTSDITVAFSTKGGYLYAGTINGRTLRFQILRTSSVTDLRPMTLLVDRRSDDQPWVVAGTVVAGVGAGQDRVYVGNNDFGQPAGATATVDLAADAANTPEIGIGGYGLTEPTDRLLALDYDRSGKQDYLLAYRPGTPMIWLLKNTGGSFAPVYQRSRWNTEDITGEGRANSADRLIVYTSPPYATSPYGTAHRLLLYRRGTGYARIMFPTVDGYGLLDWTTNLFGTGVYDPADPTDEVTAFDYDSSGRQDHFLVYRPGSGKIAIVYRAFLNGVFQWRTVYSGTTGIGGYDLANRADRVLAFDYDHSGKQDHLVLYRPGAGKISILKNTAGTFSAVYQSDSGIGGYDLADPADQVLPFDFDHSGKQDHLVLYRPGTGKISILKNTAGPFSAVYQSDSGGIGGYSLGRPADRVIAFDYESSGKQDHLVLYRPGTGIIWILNNTAGTFTRVYRGGPVGFGNVSLERRATSGQDGAAVRLALHSDGTVYAAHQRWASQPDPKIVNIFFDVVVTRDDAWATGPTPFRDLVDSIDGQVGQCVAKDRFMRYNAVLGQERLGDDLSIAVDPRDSAIVWLVWSDRPSGPTGDDWTMYVRRSTDRGQTWSGDLRRIPNAINPSLAVNARGRLGLLYQELFEDPPGTTPRWRTHLEWTDDDAWNVSGDLILHTAPSDVPVRTFAPYLGDYIRLLAVGNDFYGVFCGNNTPDTANFPCGITYQRNADWTTHKLLDLDNSTEVAVSIDPFFFHYGEELFASVDFAASTVQAQGVTFTPGSGMTYNAPYGGWMLVGSGSTFQVTFNLATVPTMTLTLDLYHCTSSRWPADGYSPVNIDVNATSLVMNFDPATAHRGTGADTRNYVGDRFVIPTSALAAGENTIRFTKQPSGQTNYWIRSLHLYR